MPRLIILVSLFFFAYNNSKDQDNSHVQQVNIAVAAKKDSIITLQMHVKKGERFSFGFVDDVFNFTMIETPEKPDTTIYERKIVSHKPMFLKDIDYRHQNFFYLIPGETYKITYDSGFPNFEVENNPKRTYEVNALKELRKHNKELKKFNEYDSEENYAIPNFKNLDLKLRDSLLKKNYEQNISFLNSYASKNDFGNSQKQILTRFLFYKYVAARLNFNMKDPKKVSNYLAENQELYSDVQKEMNCDTCFNYPEYYCLAWLFAKAFVADPTKKGVELVYEEYANFFEGKTKDYLLYNLIKFGGMFNNTKPSPMLANRFLSDAKDPTLKSYIKEIYDFLEIKKSANGILANSSGIDITWNKVLQKYKGKVVYVDFWASWCVPCRAEMPASQALQKQFAGKEVVFIYVSLDENSADWKKGSKSEGIDKAESYIIIRPEKSDLIKQHKISSIPRYFLIDKSGKIVNANAPRPSDNNIVKEIKLLL
ncbi:MAG: TlpA disulfide reductase family protein [Ferruginibacter sp.]